MSHAAPSIDSAAPKSALYPAMNAALEAVLGEERDPVANLANAAALIYHTLPGVSWAGFYLLRRGAAGEKMELVLGPFQGKIACVRIALGRGVCGAAAERRATQVVGDVRAFPGHIACDPDSRSEIVVPVIAPGERLIGVLDVDSPRLDRFDGEDRAGLEEAVRIIAGATAF